MSKLNSGSPVIEVRATTSFSLLLYVHLLQIFFKVATFKYYAVFQSSRLHIYISTYIILIFGVRGIYQVHGVSEDRRYHSFADGNECFRGHVLIKLIWKYVMTHGGGGDEIREAIRTFVHRARTTHPNHNSPEELQLNILAASNKLNPGRVTKRK